MSATCYMLGTHGASGPRGPDLAHMYHVYRPYTALITLCIGQYVVSIHATCQLHDTDTELYSTLFFKIQYRQEMFHDGKFRLLSIDIIRLETKSHNLN